jgi:hypothetical protein
VQTTVPAPVSGVTTTNCYLVLKYEWSPVDGNYMDIVAVSRSVLFNSENVINQGFILLGKAIFSGSTLQTYFDYTLRGNSSLAVLESKKLAFYVKPFNDPTVKKIHVYPGTTWINGKFIEYTGSDYPPTGTIMDTTLGRLDVLWLDATGALNLTMGPDEVLTIPTPMTFSNFITANTGKMPNFPYNGMTVALIIRGAGRTTIEGRDIIQLNPDRFSFTGSEIDVRLKGDLIVEQDVTINGNLLVNGGSVIQQGTVVEFNDNILTLNKPVDGSTPIAGFSSGFDIWKGGTADGSGFGPNDYQVVYDDNTGILKIGSKGNLNRVVSQVLTPQSKGIPFWNATSATISNKVLDYDQYFTFDNTASSKKLMIGNNTASNYADVIINGSLTINATGTFTSNVGMAFNGNVTINDANSLTYHTQDTDTRYMRKSLVGSQTMNNEIAMATGKQVKIFTTIGGITDGTARYIDDVFLLKYQYGTILSQTIETNIVMGTTGSNKTITYQGDLLDDRYARSFKIGSGTYTNQTTNIYGALTLNKVDSATGTLNVQGSLNAAYATGYKLVVNTTNMTYLGSEVVRATGVTDVTTPTTDTWQAYVRRAYVADYSTGNANTATNLATTQAIKITGVGSPTGDVSQNFDGSAAITFDISSTKVSSATLADSATKLATARNINGVAFDGTASISINAVMTIDNGATGYNAIGTITGSTAPWNSYNNSIAGRTSTGTINATGFNVASKRSLKENIEVFKVSALELIENVEVVSFNYIGDNKNKKVGFIADDTNEVFSTKQKDTMDVASTVGVLLKAVQELNCRLERLEA